MDRSPEYRYTLRSEPAYGWRTGHLPNGLPVLASTHTIVFRADGEVLSCDTHLPALMFIEEPISIKRFYIPEHGVGIVDLTETMREFAENAPGASWNDEERQEYPELIRGWLESGRYVFCCNGADFYMNSQGYVETT